MIGDGVVPRFRIDPGMFSGACLAAGVGAAAGVPIGLPASSYPACPPMNAVSAIMVSPVKDQLVLLLMLVV